MNKCMCRYVRGYEINVVKELMKSVEEDDIIIFFLKESFDNL